MPSDISIVNQALGFLGASPIISFDDDSKEAALAKANYAPVRDAVLEAYNWTFATKWLAIPALANPPLSEYANAYQIPPDVLRILFVGQDYRNPSRDWRVESGNIVTDDNAVKVQVVVTVTDPNKFSALFIQALAQRLAGDMAIALTSSRSLADFHYNVYQQKLKDAVTRDGQQGQSRKIRSVWLRNARVGTGPSSSGPVV